ncbi:putative G protein-coupled receptor-like protein [Namao virus]|nr:putative G protein-coupled receptor-like protein [Namao virus]
MDSELPPSDIDDTIYLHYNYTGRQLIRYTSDVTTMLILGCFICAFILISNIFIFVAICKISKSNKMYMMLSNLSTCDFLTGVTFFINLVVVCNKGIMYTSHLWLLSKSSMFVMLGSSMFNLVNIAVERYQAVSKTRIYSTDVTCFDYAVIVTCWSLSFIIGCLPMLGWNCIDDLPACSTIFPLYTKSYLVLYILIFVSCLSLTILIYVKIYLAAHNSAKKLKIKNLKNSALLRTIIITLSGFIGCWIPIFILFLVDVICEPHKCNILYHDKWFISMSLLNPVINPIIYIATCKEISDTLCFKK